LTKSRRPSGVSSRSRRGSRKRCHQKVGVAACPGGLVTNPIKEGYLYKRSPQARIWYRCA
jgi:hypothetical protein